MQKHLLAIQMLIVMFDCTYRMRFLDTHSEPHGAHQCASCGTRIGSVCSVCFIGQCKMCDWRTCSTQLRGRDSHIVLTMDTTVNS